ncbi:MAG: hypothetical protein HDQ88_12375 [Clostridia bacterium]|nr:hypothetical protein [Clostridia bacterium]
MTNQTLDILNPSGTLIRQHVLSANCSRKFSLMSEDSVILRFWTRDAMKFPVGSSVGDFFITKEQVGKWNETTGVWNYELKFDAYYWLWANKILRYIIPGVDSAKETSFTLTATIEIHANVIKNCLDFLGMQYGGSPFRIDTTDTSLSSEAKLVRYENLSVLGGIQAIAEAFDCEWWVKENAVYFGRCENNGSKHVFEAGINTSSISFQQAKSEAPNRLYVYGSERNLPTNYRKVDGNDTIGGVVVSRLMLPEGIPYLQTSPDIPENEIVEQVVVLDSVYPRTDLTVSEDPETYSSTTEDNEGNQVSETYYRLKYGTSFLFSESYILPSEELHIIFQSGMLNGIEFGAKFNPKGLNEKNADGSWNPDAQMIEVVVNEDYGRRLPDDVLKPQKGDKFILSGWDTTKMADLGLITDAEQELLEEGYKALEEYTKDLSTCTCPMAWDYMKPLFESNEQPKAGDVVTIIDTVHFGEGGRKSRIIGFEYKLDKPYAECIYTCGENISVKRLDSIEQKIEGLAKSGTKVQIQNSLDFLSKRYSDRTPYKLSADQGFEAGTFAEGISGARIDGRGNAEFESGKFRSFAEFAELIVNRQTAIEGDQLHSEGDKIEEVVDNGDGTYTLRLHAEWDGYFTAQIENNVCRGIYNDITSQLPAGAGQTALHGATYYTSWFRILTVNPAANTVDVVLYPDAEVPAGRNFPPAAMMGFARWGNSGSADDPRYAQRQSVMVVSSTEGRIMQLTNVTKPIIDIGNVAFVTGQLPELVCDAALLPRGSNGMYVKNIVAQTMNRVDHMGRPTPTVVDRGPWTKGETYYDGTAKNPDGVYERSKTWRDGHGWLNDLGGVATDENAPAWNSPYWTHVEGDPRLILDFEADSLVDADEPELPLSVSVRYLGSDVTLSPAIYYDWTRESQRGGVTDTLSDSLWNAAHKNAGPSLTLDGTDMNFQFGTPPDRLTFTVTATLHDPDNPNLRPEAIQFEMI